MEPRTSRVSTGLTALTVGIVIGTAASWALLFGKLDTAKPLVDRIFDSLLPVLGIACLAMAIIVPLGAWGIQRFLKGARGTIDEVVKEISAGAQAAAQKDASSSAVHAERAVLAALAWYGPIAARRWIVRTALGLLVAFGGLVGTALLFRQTALLVEQNTLLGKQNAKLNEQTDLLRDQNKKLDLNTVTAEAQRRAGLASELFSILQEGATQLKDKNASPNYPLPLTAELTARLVAFTRSANPYWTIELDDQTKIPKLADRARSAERGQLLAGLILIGAAIQPLIAKGAQFSGADLREANLDGAKLRGINLQDADLRGAGLAYTDLTWAHLNNADLSCIVDLHSKSKKCSSLYSALIRTTDFAGANLKGADLNYARAGCDLRPIPNRRQGQDLIACTDFKNSNLEDAKLAMYVNEEKHWQRMWPLGLPVGWKFEGLSMRRAPDLRR